MSKSFELLKATRTNVLKVVNNHTLEELNIIPPGFNNNIVWNLGHIIATQQLLTYKMAGLPMTIHDDYINKYRKGTKPEGNVNETEFVALKELLFSTIEKTEEDFKASLFSEYKSYETSYGFNLTDIESAIEFNNAHEAMHFGNILSMKKLI